MEIAEEENESARRVGEGGREVYGFLCRMKAFFLASIFFGERLGGRRYGSDHRTYVLSTMNSGVTSNVCGFNHATCPTCN